MDKNSIFVFTSNVCSYIIITQEHLFGGVVSMDIETLVKKAKSNDEEALNELIRMFTPFILKLTNSIYIKGYDRDDLIQMGHITIVRAVKSYRLECNRFVAYVTNAIKNNYYYEIRKVSKGNFDTSYEKMLEEGEYISLAASDISIEDSVLQKEKYKNLKLALEKLSEEDREIIIHSYWKGHGGLKRYSEITGIKYVTLHKRKKAILKKLREEMEQ